MFKFTVMLYASYIHNILQGFNKSKAPCMCMMDCGKEKTLANCQQHCMNTTLAKVQGLRKGTGKT